MSSISIAGLDDIPGTLVGRPLRGSGGGSSEGGEVDKVLIETRSQAREMA